MMKIIRATHVFPLLAIILCATSRCLAALSDKQLCYDPDCSEPVSMAKTILSYRPIDPELMAFGLNADVKVFSKGAGKRTDLWGVEISGKRGFVPKSFLKEYKILQRELSYEVPVYKFTGEVNKVQTAKLDSTEKPHPPLKDKALNDKETLLSPVESVGESSKQKFREINPDSTLSSYEVIDGTTVYLDGTSISSSMVSNVAQATRLANGQDAVSEADSVSVTDTSHTESLSDKNSLVNDKESQVDTKDAGIKVIEAPTDTEETSNEVSLESSEAISDSIFSTDSKDDILTLNGNSEPKEEKPPEVAEQEEELSDKSEESLAEDKKGENNVEIVADNVENEGIFASLTNTLRMLSSSDATAAAKDTQSSDGTPAADSKVTAENNSQEDISEDKSEIEEVTEKPDATPTVRDANLDPDFKNEEKIETEREVQRESTEREEASSVPLETTESPSNVPSDNFVHVDADKRANEPASVSIDNSTDSNSHANAQAQEANEKEVAHTISIVEDSTVSPDTRETVAEESGTAQKSNDIDQELLQTVDETPETSKLPSLEDAAESVESESFSKSHTVGEKTEITDETTSQSAATSQLNENVIVHIGVNKNDNLIESVSDNVPKQPSKFSEGTESSVASVERSVDSSHESVISEETGDQDPQNQNLPSIEENSGHTNIKNQIASSASDEETLLHYGDHISSEDKVAREDEDYAERPGSRCKSDQGEVCSLDDKYTTENVANELLEQHKEVSKDEEDDLADITHLDYNYWKTLIYLCVTAFTTLVFTLGYYYIENKRRDGQLIARINELEKKLLVSTKECDVLSENLKTTEKKLHWLTDDSIGSNEMVTSLKAELEALQIAKTELEEQVAMLEKDLENATEAGLELEKMLSAVISNNEVSPLAQSIEDLQTRLDVQQSANKSLSNALSLKAQEIESLSTELASVKRKCNELEVELSQTQDELATQSDLKNNIEETLTDRIHDLEEQVKDLGVEKSSLHKELKAKEIEMKELTEMIGQIKSNNLDLEKLYDVSRVKTEAALLRDERDELKMRLNDAEGAHQLLEEHMQLVKEEIVALSDQCKVAESQCRVAEKEKKDAETKLEVLTKFFQEKEAERQKEEAIWLEKQGEVVSTVERIHTMQNEIQSYKQQIEMLKREIIDQEREYKNHISALDKKAHEQWIAARQNERRLVESKAEAGQLRNRLTLVEKNLNDSDAEVKLHRLEANGDTTASPSLFIGAETSSSPVMFSGSSTIPPPPPPTPYYLHCFAPFHMPPLPPGLPSYDISQRPPPLGGRLSSPPPMPPPLLPPLHPSPTAPGDRYENAGSPPPLMHLLPPFGRHRSPPPPPPPFGGDHIPPPPPPGSVLPPPPLGTTHPWGEKSLPLPRNSGFHPHQREQRARNHKGSLHSSGESLDKAHHGKV